MAGRIRRVNTFPKGICPKVNVIARLEFELTYYDPAVHRFNHYTTKTPCLVSWGCRIYWLHLCRGVRPNPLTSALYMTLNNLMVRFQQCWSFGECGIPLHCHRSQVHSGPGVVAPDIYGLNRTNSILMLNWIVWINWIAWNRNAFLQLNRTYI